MKQENNTQDKLKPCPFCGSRDVKIQGIECDYEGEYLYDINPESGLRDGWDSYSVDYLAGYAVICDNCSCRLDGRNLRYGEESKKQSRLSAIKEVTYKWNTRADLSNSDSYKDPLYDVIDFYAKKGCKE